MRNFVKTFNLKIMSDIHKLSIDTDTLLDTFQLVRTQDCVVLAEWLSASGELNDFEQQLLTVITQRALFRMGGWNEEELKMKFISHLFLIANIEEENRIATFFERSLSAVIEGHKLTVICDCLVATPKGYTTPKAPYFFLQEYKKQKGDSNDPEGQMLAAMLIAQYQNNDNKPLYGAWLVGSIWNFTVLNGKNYCTSLAFDANNHDDLQQIVFILKKLKELILNH